MIDAVRIAAAQYRLEPLKDLLDFRDKVGRLVAEAAGRRADILVFPEYTAMELVSFLPPAPLDGQMASLQPLIDDYTGIFSDLAVRHGLWIVAGSAPVRTGRDAFRNRAWLCAPDGTIGHQDKLVLTRFEREHMEGLAPGDEIRVFDTPFGPFGIDICYDIEFPAIAKAQAEAGARLLFAPCCTDTLAGHHRVRTGCLARALENQCFVVQSPLVGEAHWSDAIDCSTGAAAICIAPDELSCADGVVASGSIGGHDWLFADIDLALVDHLRRDGAVRTFDDRQRPVPGVAVRSPLS